MKRTKQLLAILLCLCCLLSCAVFAGAAEGGEIRNVIFMIGDGMGYNHLKLAEEQGYEIFMDDSPDLQGWSRTRSTNNKVTDSAAGATALSCGVRTNNGMLCVFPDEEKRELVQPRIITENAILHGMKTGIVTTDETNGATPAGYSVHTLSRSNTDDIIAQQLKSKIDLILGKKQSAATKSAVEAAGFRYLSTRADLEALTVGTRGYGQFGSSLWKLNLSDSKPSLAQMSQKAISLLNGDKGFFLMVEGAHIDKNADDSQDGIVDYPVKVMNTAEAVKTFDDAVRAAVDFAREDGHTLVVITADHETGDLRYEEETGRMTFHSASHSAANVPVFVYGATDLFENGAEMDNRDIANLIAAKLGWEERFPIEDPVSTDPDPEEEPVTETQPVSETEPAKTDGSADSSSGFFDCMMQSIRDFFARIAQWFRDLFDKMFG